MEKLENGDAPIPSSIAILSSENVNGDVTDEDSGEDDDVTLYIFILVFIPTGKQDFYRYFYY